ncbi:MAG: ATP-binding cassette domain-containing protein, partial [Bacteroidaceae bacterium]|nr:ATP-binding cassette domain-containing protein [Bacteroidaceae bacterium]
MNIILEIDNITIEYDKKCVLRNFSMSIERGTSVAVIGASGCGKSSLLKAIIGIVPMSSGSIKLDGVVLSPQSI